MRVINLITAIAALLFFVAASYGQQDNTPQTITVPSAQASKILSPVNSSSIDLPKSKEAWTVQILTSGGILGNSKGDLVLTSDGIFSHNQIFSSERQTFTSVELEELSSLISKVNNNSKRGKLFVSPQSQKSAVSLCRDCYKTTLILLRRGTNGKVSFFSVSWDAGTQAADDVLEVYKRVVNLVTAKEQAAT